ncbi:MAG: hypothetical protein IKR21_05580 [Oscillospiraceae bacterium]|nr:hypothetical protein [Oscillospiraceae bacterium]
MSELFIKILNLSITASWLIAAVLLLRLIFRKAPRWIFCALWGLAGLRLVCPVSIESALSLIPSRETIPANIAVSPSPGISSGIPALNQTVNPVISETFAPEAASSASPLQTLLPILAAVWIAGAAVMLIYALVSYLRLRRRVAVSISMGDGVFACDDIKSPFILGVFRPRIYVPSTLTGETLSCVAAHERAHLKRRDHLWKPLGFLILAVYWFNPLCWTAYILLCRDIESACDEKVVRDMDRQSLAAYSQALLDCSMPKRRVAACPLAFGETGVKQRVKGVLNYKKPAFWIIIVAIIVCAAVAVCLMTDPFSSKSVTGKLALSMDEAIMEHNRDSYHRGDFAAAAYDVLKVEKGAGVTTVYAWIMYEEYSFDGVDIITESGSDIPTAVTFDTTDKGDGSVYPVLEYWQPRDGTYYAGDIKDKFPMTIRSRALDVSGAKDRQLRCRNQAREFFGVEQRENEQTLIGTITDISNGVLYIKPIPGTPEASSSDSFTVPIVNMPPSPEPIVGDSVEVKYNGEILETFPATLGEIYHIRVIRLEEKPTGGDGLDGLRSKFPEYFGLSDFKGLEVYVWQLAPNIYNFGLLPGTNRNKTDTELWSLKPASTEEMRAILSTYDVPPEDIFVIPFQNPISSYFYETDEEYAENIKLMLLNGDDGSPWLTVTSGGKTITPDGVFCWSETWSDDWPGGSGWIAADGAPWYMTLRDSLEDLPAVTLGEDFALSFGGGASRSSSLRVYTEDLTPLREDWYGDTAKNWLPEGTYYCVVGVHAPVGRYIETEKRFEESAYDFVFRLEATGKGPAPYKPGEVKNLVEARLVSGGREAIVTDAASLRQLESWLDDPEVLQGGAGCPFGSLLYLTRKDGRVFSLCPAEDSCGTAFSDGVYYKFAGGNEELWKLFAGKLVGTVTAYAGSVEDTRLIYECLNGQTMMISSVRHPPVFTIETKAELDDFRSRYSDILSFDAELGGEPSFNEAAAKYDEDFFRDNALMLAYVASGSTAYRFGAYRVSRVGSMLCMQVTQTNSPEIHDDAMACWFVFAEVSARDMKMCTQFDAWMM